MLIRAFVCVVTSAVLAFSAEETGTISGKIREASSGEALRGATVILEGTKKGAISDPKGNFVIKNVPAGTYSITVRYVGYETKRIPNIVVTPGKVTTLSVVLDRDRQVVAKDVIVEARRTTETQAALLAQRKNSAQVSDGVSIEEIKKLPDTDAGQALRRVSSVTLAGDKFLIVRGTSDRYNNAMLNGVVLTSTEPDRKAFTYDLLPSELLESATIAKTFTPDLPGNFTGGMVELSTVEFPSQSMLRVSFGSSVNDNAFMQPGRYISSPSGRWDWLGFDDGTRSRLFTFAVRVRHAQASTEGLVLARRSRARIVISSPLHEHFIEPLTEAILRQPHLDIVAGSVRSRWEVTGVVAEQPPVFRERLMVRLLSPVVVSVPGEYHPQYFRALDERVPAVLRQNAFKQYRLVTGSELRGQLTITVDRDYVEGAGGDRSRRISSLHRVKVGHTTEVAIRAFSAPLQIEGDRHLIKVLYDCGIGEKSSLGVGCWEPIVPQTG